MFVDDEASDLPIAIAVSFALAAWWAKAWTYASQITTDQQTRNWGSLKVIIKSDKFCCLQLSLIFQTPEQQEVAAAIVACTTRWSGIFINQLRLK